MESYQHSGENPRECARVNMSMTSINTSYKPLSTRARARKRARAYEEFYDPAIESDLDAAVDYAMDITHGDRKFWYTWRDYCLFLGINNFNAVLDRVMKEVRKGRIDCPARLFHSRIREMRQQIDESRKRVDLMRQKQGGQK